MAEPGVEVGVGQGFDQAVGRRQFEHARRRIRRTLDVQPVGQRGVEHLRAGQETLAELVRRLHGRHQLDRNGHPFGVGGERAQHGGVPRPLLQQLAGGLDEVPLGRYAREAHPPLLAADDVVNQVAELVKQGHHVAVIHEATGKVAHQHALGQLRVEHAGHHVEVGRVVVLALAWVQVEVNPAQRGAVIGGADVVGGHVGVPRVGVGRRNRREPQPEQPRGHLEQPVVHLGEVEVASHLRGVHPVALAFDQFGVVPPVRHVDDALAVLDGPLAQHGDLTFAGRQRGGADGVDELCDRRPTADHLDFGVVVGPVGIAQQARQFVPKAQQLGQHRVVDRPGQVEERVCHRPAGCGVGGEGEKRVHVGVLGRDAHHAVVVGRVRRHVVGGQPGQGAGRHPRDRPAVSNVARERLAQFGEPRLELTHPAAHLLVAIDARAAKRLQHLGQQAGGSVVQFAGLHRRQGGIHVRVEVQVGLVTTHRHFERLGPFDHRLVGVHRGQQVGQRAGVAQRRGGVVPQGQHARVAARQCQQLGHALPGRGEFALAVLVQPAQPVGTGQCQCR